MFPMHKLFLWNRMRCTLLNLEKKIFTIIAILKSRQQKIQDEYDKEKGLKMHSLNNMNIHIKVADMLATEWANPKLKDLMEECKDIWLNEVYPCISKYPFLYADKEFNYGFYGKMLTGLAFLFGNYHLGLTYLITTVEIEPWNSFVYALSIKWSCLLGEFDTFKMLDQNHHHECLKDCDELLRVCRLCCKFFDPVQPSSDEMKEILDSLMEIEKPLSTSEGASHQSYYARHLIHHILGNAAMMPSADIHTYGDYNYHMKKAAECSLGIITVRIEGFMHRATTPLTIYSYTKLSDASEFIVDALSMTDYFVTEKAYCQALFSAGCINDCETRILCNFFIGTKVVAPVRVLDPLNLIHFVKLRTANDHDKLIGVRAMTTLLIGRVFEDSSGTTVSSFRTKLLESDYKFEIKTVDQSITVKSAISNTLPFAKHHQTCRCFVCYEIKNNPSVFVQQSYSMLLLENLSLDIYKKNIDEIQSSGSLLFEKAQKQLYRTFCINSAANTICKLPLLMDICMIICNCLLVNPDMPLLDRNVICDSVINSANVFPSHLRSYWLLARQMKRTEDGLVDKFPWLSPDADEDTIIKEIMELRRNSSETNSEDYSMLSEAEDDFELYGHALTMDWRRRICLYLGAGYLQIDAWKSAFYFIESFGTSLRQYLRIEDHHQMDLRIKNIKEFKHVVCELPYDFTYIQFVVDDENILWLIRLSDDFDPIVVPITQISTSSSSISQSFLNLLTENDKCMKDYESPDYWTIRESLEARMKQLIEDVQNVWFRRFRCLLKPFGPIDREMKNDIIKVIEVFEEYGFLDDYANFLAVLFFHVDANDFKFMLRIFCFLQDQILDTNVPENIFNTLMNIFSNEYQLSEHSLMSDKYVVLAVSQELSTYPWECLPIFAENSLVTRIQSFHFLVRLLVKCEWKVPLLIDTEKSYCFLSASEKLLYKTVDRMTGELNIDKFAGYSTDEEMEQENFLNIIKNTDIFLYLGHGHGSFNYVALRSVENCRTVPILMGCSSVRIEDEGRGFDGNSVVHDFMIAGAPAVIGCLWMVSDGELDKFFIKFIELCATEWSNRINSIDLNCQVLKCDPNVRIYPNRLMIKAMIEARKACRLPLLTGAAVVAYGIPVETDSSHYDAYVVKRFNLKKSNNNVNVVE